MKYNKHTKGTKKPGDTGPASNDPSLTGGDWGETPGSGGGSSHRTIFLQWCFRIINPVRLKFNSFAPSFNGRTPDSESDNLGSNPCGVAKIR